MTEKTTPKDLNGHRSQHSVRTQIDRDYTVVQVLEILGIETREIEGKQRFRLGEDNGYWIEGDGARHVRKREARVLPASHVIYWQWRNQNQERFDRCTTNKEMRDLNNEFPYWAAQHFPPLSPTEPEFHLVKLSEHGPIISDESLDELVKSVRIKPMQPFFTAKVSAPTDFHARSYKEYTSQAQWKKAYLDSFGELVVQ